MTLTLTSSEKLTLLPSECRDPVSSSPCGIIRITMVLIQRSPLHRAYITKECLRQDWRLVVEPCLECLPGSGVWGRELGLDLLPSSLRASSLGVPGRGTSLFSEDRVRVRTLLLFMESISVLWPFSSLFFLHGFCLYASDSRYVC